MPSADPATLDVVRLLARRSEILDEMLAVPDHVDQQAQRAAVEQHQSTATMTSLALMTA